MSKDNIVKFLYFTDLHDTTVAPACRNEDYYLNVHTKMKEIVEIANKAKVDAVLFGGDLSHKKSGVTMYELRELARFFRSFNQVFGVLGSHDVSGYQVNSKHYRAAGVLETAGLVQWVGKLQVKVGSVVIGGASHGRDYETPKSYGMDFPYDEDNVVIWLSHGMLQPDDKKVPWEHVRVKDLAGLTPDILLNGHDHANPWEVEIESKRGQCTVINGGSIGRTAIDDKHTPSVIVLAIDTKAKRWKHKRVELKSALSHEQVFDAPIGQDKPSTGEEIEAFVRALKEESRDLKDEDLKAVVRLAAKDKPEKVLEAVMVRLEQEEGKKGA